MLSAELVDAVVELCRALSGHYNEGALQWESARTDDGSTPAAFEREALLAAIARGLAGAPVPDRLQAPGAEDAAAVLDGSRSAATTPDNLPTPKKGASTITQAPNAAPLLSEDADSWATREHERSKTLARVWPSLSSVDSGASVGPNPQHAPSSNMLTCAGADKSAPLRGVWPTDAAAADALLAQWPAFDLKAPPAAVHRLSAVGFAAVIAAVGSLTLGLRFW